MRSSVVAAAGRVVVAAAGMAFVAGVAACSAKPAGPRVAAAADLSRALVELEHAYAAKTGVTPVADFGASGLLATQIGEGAPYSLFLAANKAFADQAAASGKCDASTEQVYALGHLVAWTSSGPAPRALADLADPRWKKIAIANPDHAPYGRAAKQALVRAGIWDQVESRVVIAEDVQAAVGYARSGSTDVALISRSLVPAEGSGAQLAVDPALYDPLEQTLVVCGTGETAAAGKQLAAFVMSPEGREVLGRYGFSR